MHVVRIPGKLFLPDSRQLKHPLTEITKTQQPRKVIPGQKSENRGANRFLVWPPNIKIEGKKGSTKKEPRTGSNIKAKEIMRGFSNEQIF